MTVKQYTARKQEQAPRNVWEDKCYLSDGPEFHRVPKKKADEAGLFQESTLCSMSFTDSSLITNNWQNNYIKNNDYLVLHTTSWMSVKIIYNLCHI